MRIKRGITLIEIIVAMTIGALAGGMVMMALRRQQRFYSSATDMMRVRTQLRDAADVLVADIRSAPVSRYGLQLMTDTAVEFFATIGTSIICAAPSGRTVFLPPQTLSSGTTLTSFLALPDTGDLALMYSGDSSRWTESPISSFASRALSTSCPASTGFTSNLDAAAGRSGYALTLPQTAPAEIRKGAPVRFLRRARYSLYKSSDGDWYLGYRRCNAVGASSCATIQPVSGPFLTYSKAAQAGGMSFRYFGAGGNEIFDAALSPLLARIDVTLRGETRRAVSLAGDARTPYRDSAVISISPRNRAR